MYPPPCPAPPRRAKDQELAALRSRCLQQEGAARAKDKELGKAARAAEAAKVGAGGFGGRTPSLYLHLGRGCKGGAVRVFRG